MNKVQRILLQLNLYKYILDEYMKNDFIIYIGNIVANKKIYIIKCPVLERHYIERCVKNYMMNKEHH